MLPDLVELSSTEYYMIINKQSRQALYINPNSDHIEKQVLQLVQPNVCDLGQIWMLDEIDSEKYPDLREIVHAASTLVLTKKGQKDIHLRFGQRHSNQLFNFTRQKRQTELNLFSIRPQKGSTKVVSFHNQNLICSQAMIVDTSCMWDVVPAGKNDCILETCTIVAAKSKMVLDVPRACKKRGTQICLYSLNNRFNQRWRFKRVNQHGGCFLIQNVHSKLFLDIKGAKGKKGVKIIQWEQNGGKNQLWRLKFVDDKTFTIVSVLEQKLAIAVEKGKQKELADIVTGQNCQQNAWIIDGMTP